MKGELWEKVFAAALIVVTLAWSAVLVVGAVAGVRWLLRLL